MSTAAAMLHTHSSQWRHLKHYAAIEWELCTGTLLYIREFLARQAAKR